MGKITISYKLQFLQIDEIAVTEKATRPTVSFCKKQREGSPIKKICRQMFS